MVIIEYCKPGKIYSLALYRKSLVTPLGTIQSHVQGTCFAKLVSPGPSTRLAHSKCPLRMNRKEERRKEGKEGGRGKQRGLLCFCMTLLHVILAQSFTTGFLSYVPWRRRSTPLTLRLGLRKWSRYCSQICRNAPHSHHPRVQPKSLSQGISIIIAR